MASSTIQRVLRAERVAQDPEERAQAAFDEPWMVVLALDMITLNVDALLDLPAAILLLGALFAAIGQAIGLDLVQLGLMMVGNLATGPCTPPREGAVHLLGAFGGEHRGDRPRARVLRRRGARGLRADVPGVRRDPRSRPHERDLDRGSAEAERRLRRVERDPVRREPGAHRSGALTLSMRRATAICAIGSSGIRCRTAEQGGGSPCRPPTPAESLARAHLDCQTAVGRE